MVLNHIFSKSPDKHKTKTKEKEKDKEKDKDREKDRERSERVKAKPKDPHPLSQRIVIPPPPPKDSPKPPDARPHPHPQFHPQPHPPPSSPESPRKPSSTASSPRKSPTKSVRSSHRDYFQHSRSSSTTSKRSFTISRRYSSARDIRDPDSHPLNLPPDELRRLTAMAAREDARSSMDVEESPSSSTTAPVTSPSGETTNGANSAQEDRSPTPPPHRSSPPAPDAESFKLAGNKFYKAGDYDRAVQEYNKAIEINPNSSAYLSNRAAAYLSAARYLEALEDCQRAHELDPTNPKILHRLARILTYLGRPAEALDVLSKVQPPASATDRAPAEKMLRFISQAEETLRNEKGGSMAMFCLDQARQGLGSRVKQPRKWALLTGEAHLKMGNDNAFGKAQDIAIGLLRENNQDPDALLLRARAFYGQGDNDQAVKYLRMCLSLDPDSKQAVKLLRMVQKLTRTKEEGNSAFKARDYQKAIDLWTKTLEIDPDNKDVNSKVLGNRAQAYINLKDYDSAIKDSTEALRLDPSYLKAQKLRAKAHGAAGNWEEAIKDYKAVAEVNPGEKGIQEDIRTAEFELKKSQRKDYYKILGISKDASDTEIKKAYRKLAIQYHPDKNRNSEDSDAKFKEIGEAYETLIDPQKRASYDNGDDLMDPADMFGHGGFSSNMGGMGGMGGASIDPNILFNMMNGGGGFASAGGHPFASRGGFGGGFPF
ncbi:DnaJ domain protein [Paecilomyces variotii No. 5]|uniref:DnaJ domain protein n=1 Tax=Byssochlamys spectabilis (strain No. 5 / NBRC 109023) TaxID=1356009 RepID=V5HYE8_BYSSN|nr:DnaJ domain protein [Paecilomyces variotii No. 5]